MKTILSLTAGIMLSAAAAIAGTPQNVNVDVQRPSDILLSDITDNVTLIPLTGTQETQIPSVSRVISGRNILIVSSDKNTDQYLFDRKGQFVANLCQDSHIHARHTESDIFLCDYLHYSSLDGNRIYMFDAGSNRIYTYGRSGDVLAEEDLALRNGTDRKILLHIRTKGGWYEWNNVMPGGNLFYEYSDLSKKYSIHKSGSDTIFTVSKKSGAVTPSFAVAFPGNGYSEDLSMSDAAQLMNYPYMHPDRAGLISGHASTGNVLYFNYRYNNGTHDALYNSKTGNLLNGKLVCDLFEGGDVKVVGSSDRGIIFAIRDPWHLKLTDRSYTVFSRKDLSILESITPDTDFILMEIKLKNF